MAKVEMWTRNGDKVTVEEGDPDKVRQLEESTFDSSSNIERTRTTGA